ncbi:MAG: class I SAM-dependent methyltransferase, partial [Nitratireductor sp.]|nr:class I SAM-dependent methyltransferase [Nitratireductor sp.]
AIDIACGLGDNAEAMAAAGYRTTAFDLARKAVAWARQRFPDSAVDYQVADLLNPPSGWNGGFDLVHECYTLQAVPPAMLDRMTAAIAALLAPSGRLLVYTRIRPDGSETSGPPWPLQESDAMGFASYGLQLVSRDSFELVRPDRRIPHWFCIWQKPEIG